jgi:hypothetical protein
MTLVSLRQQLTLRLPLVGLATAMVIGIASPAAMARDPATIYLRERAYAQWVVPTNIDRRVIVYTVSGATYQDLEAGTTVQFAEVTRSRCFTSRNGRECGTPQVQEYATPRLFDVADDLSEANLELPVGSSSVSAIWTPHPATNGSFPPMTAEYAESCPDGSGAGRGLYRRMQVSADVLGKRFSSAAVHVTRSWVDRAVIRTDCRDQSESDD